MIKTMEQLPRWDLSNVFTGLEADDFGDAVERLKGWLDDLDSLLAQKGIDRLEEVPGDSAEVASVIDPLIERLNDAIRLTNTLEVYVYSFVTTDSYDKTAARVMSEVEQLEVRLKKQAT
ncbi:hypothetical protein ACFL6M_06805, partial [Candidatus Eisenbacteria bacterium]